MRVDAQDQGFLALFAFYSDGVGKDGDTAALSIMSERSPVAFAELTTRCTVACSVDRANRC